MYYSLHYFPKLVQQRWTFSFLLLKFSLRHVNQVLFSFSASRAEESDPHLLCFLVVAIDRAPTSSIRWTRQRRDKVLSKIIYRHTFPEMKNKFPSTLISLSITTSSSWRTTFLFFIHCPTSLLKEPSNTFQSFIIFHNYHKCYFMPIFMFLML